MAIKEYKTDNIHINFNIVDSDGSYGTSGQVLSRDAGGVTWINGSAIPGAGGTVTGTGATNYIPKWTSATSLGNSNVYVSSQGVSIGTTTPSYNNNYGYGDLNVENNVYASSQVFTHNSTAGNYSFFGLGKSSGTGASPTIVQAQETIGVIGWYGYDGAAYKRLASIGVAVDGTPGAGDMPGRLMFGTSADGAATPTERMRIDSAGNVGIGTVNPLDPLNVQSTGASDYAFRIFRSTSATQGLAGFYEGSANQGQLYLLKGDNTVGVLLNSSGDSYLNGGDVGIGTTNPSSQLHVKGNTVGGNVTTRFEPQANNAQSTLYLSSTGSGDGGYYYDSNNNTSGLFSYGDYTFNVGTTNISGTIGDPRMVIKQGGNVGIGTTSPNYKLSVSGGIEAGGGVRYSKYAGGLDTTGYAIAGLGTAFNGSSAGFTFTAYGGTGQYQKVVYSCFGSGTNWVVDKVIDEGTNVFDIEASASSAATIVFTFKTRSGSQGYSPRVVIEATGHSIISTYA